MSTRFIGYEPKTGTFQNEKTGEMIDYSNRKLKFITDDSQSKSVHGFSYFEFAKVKRSLIADSLGVPDTEIGVDKALDSMLMKPVNVTIAPVNNELSFVGMSLSDNKQP